MKNKQNKQKLLNVYISAYRNEDKKINPHLYTKTGKLSKNKKLREKGRRYNWRMDYFHEQISRIYNECLDAGIKLELEEIEMR